MRLRPIISFALVGFALTASAADPLETGFLRPPDSAKPQTWWHWMNGNITKAGITADLEAMKQIGLGGATIVNVDCDIPRGPVSFMSPAWRADFKFAVQEADRLGLKLCVPNCAGWSSSGGPWNTPSNAMQRLTASETRAQGPVVFDAVLPTPMVNLGFYRDIAVLAFKDPSIQPAPAANTASTPAELKIKHAVYEGVDNGGSADVTAKLNDLIQTGRKSVVVNDAEMGGDPALFSLKQLRVDLTLDGNPATARVGQGDTFLFPITTNQLATLSSFDNTLAGRTFVHPPAALVPSADGAVPHDGVVNLTTNLASDGRLHWDVPPGNWVILRLGYTPIGVENHPAPPEGRGLECDKLSKTALDAHWDGFMQKVLTDIGPLAGQALDSSLIDSYEIGVQDWTANFREEFEKRRGYDPLKFLPTFTRRIVDNPAVTERFLWDMRRTVADLFAENYFGHFAELCHQHGLKNVTEPYTGPFESLQCGATADIVMGEFWAGFMDNPTAKLAASVAHSYGKTIVGAESFTAWEGRWQDDPYSLKIMGDLKFCHGINRYYFHRFAMQPWTNRWPGMTMGPFGFNFDRTVTWWKPGKAWIDYISRCEFLLQQGRAVADAAYFTGETAPMVMPAGKPALPAGYDFDAVNADVLLHGATVKAGRITLASGANYAVLILPADKVNLTPLVLARLRELVRAGATIIGPRPQHSPSLADYPHCDAEVKKLAGELWGPCDGTNVLQNNCGQGHVIWGKSLTEVLAAQKLKPDFEFKSAAGPGNLAYVHRATDEADIYFVSNQRQEFEVAEGTFRSHGKLPELWHPDTGVIEPAPVWQARDGRTTMRLDLEPAGSVFIIFRHTADAADHVIAARRRSATGSDSAPKLETLKLPTPATVGFAPRWKTSIAADGSPVITAWDNGLFELLTAGGKILHAEVANLPAPQEVTGAWRLDFPTNWGAPPTVTLDKLISWADHTNSGVRYFSGTATYEREIEIAAERLGVGRELWLDLGVVKNFAEVSLNGQDLGVLWKPPFQVNITAAAKPGANHLVVKVTNLWPNRLIGDEQLPPDCEWDGQKLKAWPPWLLNGQPSPTGRLTFTTWHHWTKDAPLLPSGLLGPVTLSTADIIPAK